MDALDIPLIGKLLLGASLAAAGYTFMLSVASARRPHLARATRWGSIATVSLISCGVFVLAYAFQAHEFSIRYVARYSDRSMAPIYLWTALWGGQDGSLLWWTFLSSGYTGAFTIWIGDKYRPLQPAMFATLMSVLIFFLVLQLFAANPFATTFGAVVADGEGLNPLLQNYWMAIHPPALYLGLTGWCVPFAFVVAALVTGRLDYAWIQGVRRWVLLAWAFLTLGNMLGMFWSYEELGWGGYWAWDPVENASFLPWLTATAYVHSVQIQERRGTLKVWNVFLLCTTFVLTIFGTFLTRSGLIASVHSFARSDIGIYFGIYLILLSIFVFVIIAWRLPDLREGRRIGWVEWATGAAVGIIAAMVLVLAEVAVGWGARLSVVPVGVVFVALLKGIEVLRLDVLQQKPSVGKPQRTMESFLSREFAFLLNNWILLGMAVFVLVATTFPLLSELLRDETVTVGPDYYNKWMVPLGLILLLLTGIGPLIAWRKATGKNLLKAFRFPLAAGALMFVVHLTLGGSVGFPAFVPPDELYDTWVGVALGKIYSVTPLFSTTLCAFVVATVVQEFARGASVRMKTKNESALMALINLVIRARRRYGGYIVHVGVVLMFWGFTGSAYDQEAESSLRPGQSLSIGGLEFRYDGVRMESDTNKRAVYTDMTILRDDGSTVTTVEPAKFIYRSHPDMPTTEVSISTSPLRDLYVIMSSVDPQTRRGTFRVIERPMVMWIWLGGGILLFGVFVAAMPKLSEVLSEAKAPRPRRTMAVGVATLLIFLLALAAWALAPPIASAQSDSSSTLHAGSVIIENDEERRLFSRLLCECGDCQRLPLHTCGCSWADGMRSELRGRLDRGDEINTIVSDYRERFGSASIAVPSDEGLDRALWAVPLGAFVLAAIGLVVRGRRVARLGEADTDAAADDDDDDGDDLDDQLEDELRRFEGD